MTRVAPSPEFSPADSALVLRTALLAQRLPGGNEPGRVLCVSLGGRAVDSAALAQLGARRPTTSPPFSCPPTEGSWVIPPELSSPVKDARDPDFLTLGKPVFWTRDVAVVWFQEGRGSYGTHHVCDLVRVPEAPGWRVARCRNYWHWIS